MVRSRRADRGWMWRVAGEQFARYYYYCTCSCRQEGSISPDVPPAPLRLHYCSSIWERREEEKDKSRRDLLYDCAPAPGTAKAGALVHVSITWYLGTRSYLLYMYLPKLIGTVVHVGANAKNILNPTA